MQIILAASILFYLGILFVLAWISNKRIRDAEDFIVAGRRLSPLLGTCTLLATWFGAGTVLTTADEVRESGLKVTALEPFGAGLCLILAAFFFAKPLWEMKLLTVPDFFRVRFGKKAEVWSAILMSPGYLGWIAVQLVALAGILNVFFDLSMPAGVILVAAVTTLYTLWGGMWAVALTDAVQLALVILGLIVLGWTCFAQFGDGSVFDGIFKTVSQSDPAKLEWIPWNRGGEFMQWISLLAIASLGNLPAQDLMQRIFSMRSAPAAQTACLFSGGLYILFGLLPVGLALLSVHVLPGDVDQSVLPLLAKSYLSPAVALVFIIALISVVLSTIDGAILAPSTLIAHNLLRRVCPERYSTIRLCQFCILGVSAASVVLALSGNDAFALLEASYATLLVALFVPLIAGLFFKRKNEMSALWAMGVGTVLWLPELFIETSLPLSLIATAGSLAAYVIHSRL